MKYLPVLLFFSLVFLGSLAAQQPQPPIPPAFKSLDEAEFRLWTGLKPRDPSMGGGATLDIPGEAMYRAQKGPRGAYSIGLKGMNDSTIDLSEWYGLRFEIELDRDNALFAADFTLSIPPQGDRRNMPDSTSARALMQGRGWRTVTVPFGTFDFNRGQASFISNTERISLKGSYLDGKPGTVALKNVRLVRANALHLAADLRSAPAEAGKSVAYPVRITNTSDAPQIITLAIQRHGWEGIPSEVTPAMLTLKPGESSVANVKVTVPVSTSIPQGANEKQTLVATVQGGSVPPVEMEFITLRRLPFPYLTFSEAEWQGVRDKVEKHDWAKEELSAMAKKADSWEVPEVGKGLLSDRKVPTLFRMYGPEQNVQNAARAWKLTGNKAYAEKAALFLRRMSDPINGYPVTLQATTGDIPQEGGFFECCVNAYELIQDAGVLSDADKLQIENSFRIYVKLQVDGLAFGGISNWSVFNLGPAALCALAVQDLVSFDALLYGSGGLADHLRYGVMDDGWWYEMSLSYNLGCANAYTSVGLAARPFGLDVLNQKFPVALTEKVGLRPFEFEKFLGMAFGKYGPVRKPNVTIKDMWDGIIIYPDYRGIMFGMGDGHEQIVSGETFERAYYAFRDPAYAAIIKRGKRDLIYCQDLPDETPKTYAVSGHSDNAGVAVLRSQTPGREPREQIQAAMKYGTHGSYHGHFDRLSLLSLMRYGRSFYNPETSWYGYGSYMYKWWVQPSLAHNMVVVDAKQQVPEPSVPLLFHTGPMLQVSAAENTSAWSQPPYMGGYDQVEGVKSGDRPWVPIPENYPKPGVLTGFTEPVRQRRAIIVTDDYVVVADDLKAEKEHTFDNLLHLRGARLANAESDAGRAKLKMLGHAAQFDTNPLGGGQFITNVQRYSAEAPVLIESVHRIGGKGRATDSYADTDTKYWETGGARSLSEPGDLHLDERVLWPLKPEIFIGDYPESRPGGRKLAYEVRGDGKSLASGKFGAWLLGSGVIDADLAGIKVLELSAESARPKGVAGTLFWGNAVLLTKDGKELALKDLAPGAVVTENIVQTPQPGLDYEGGPIRIAGTPLGTATAAEPRDDKKPSIIRVNLEGLGAVRFKATIGGDWPVGPEEQLRKTVAVRSTGTTAQFLTLIEPYETKGLVKSAAALGPDKLRVELSDGRVQEITISNLRGDDAKKLSVEIVETRYGKTLRKESTHGNATQ